MPRRPEQSDTVRLEAFSDGVFAIAITLLVLEIHVPSIAASDHGRALPAALLHLWPSFLGYTISFVTIGIMWANHHSIFRYVRATDRTFTLINVGFLMCISFLPFPTALLAEYLPVPDGRRTAVAVYSATFIVVAIAFNALWRYAVWENRLLADDHDRAAVRVITTRYLLGPVSYGVSLALAFVNVWASLAVHGLLAAYYVVSEHQPLRRR